MEVAVVIVTVGNSQLLERSLASIAGGRRKPREVVLVDQSGHQPEPALSTILADARITFKHLPIPPTGVSQARNEGAAAASGGLLAFTDDDCLPDDDWLATLTEALDAEGVAAATGRVLPLDEGVPGLVAVSSRTDTRERVFKGGGDYSPWEVGTGGNLLVERDAFEAIGGFSREFGPGGRFRSAEDIEFLERLIADGSSIHYAPAAVVYHEMKPPSGRMARRVPYGFGMGALIVRLPRGRRLLTAGRYLRMQVRTLVSAIVRFRFRRASETALTLVGACAGFVAAAARRTGREAG